MPSLKVLKRGPLRERVRGGKLRTLYPGTVFDATEERATKLLKIVPALVEKVTEKVVTVTKDEDRAAKIKAAKKKAEEASE